MDYRIVNINTFKVVGKKIHTTMENRRSYQELPEFWMNMQQGGDIPAILSLMNQEPFGLWLPYSGYEFAVGPDVEVYGQDNTVETWIPIKKIKG